MCSRREGEQVKEASDMGDRKSIMPRVIAVVGGARGVGRSSIALNLAVAAAQRARRVCLLDATGGPQAGGTREGATLLDVVAGRARLSDALQPGPDGIEVLPLTGGDRRTAARVSDSVLLAHVDALEARFDLVFVDTPSGAQPRGLFFAAAATDVLVVLMPEAPALRQAEALVRTLASRCGRRELLALPNACPSAAVATTVAHALAALAARPPHVRIRPLGWIPYDDAVSQARRARRTLVASTPDSPAAQALASAADRLVALAPARATGGAQFFFQSLIAQGRAA
jgi:flagellar biosynthesis protein FlhG